MTTTLDSLANETLSDIFAACESSDLYQASLVCRRWRALAQRALFSWVQLDEGSAQAHEWLASPARRRYRLKGMRITSELPLGLLQEAYVGITSLNVSSYDETLAYEWLLHPALADLKSLTLWRPENITIPPAGHTRHFPTLELENLARPGGLS